jgi:hypothetical protein
MISSHNVELFFFSKVIVQVVLYGLLYSSYGNTEKS